MRSAPVDLSDLDAIVALESTSFAVGAWDRAAVRGSLEDPFGLHLGLRGPNGGLLGVALAQVIFEHAELQRILVAPGQRRRGLGRVLMMDLVAACAARGAEVLSLEVRAENTPARALYVAMGMRPAGRRPAYYTDGEDALLYAIDLLPSPALERP